MEFEETIREIANEIYEKVVAFVNENKEDDDLYYEYAFIKLNNGVEIQYDFRKNSIEKTSKNSPWLSNSIIKILNGDTDIMIDVTKEDDYKCTFIDYDTSLNKKIETCNRDNLKRAYKIQLSRQQKLTEEEKNQIKSYYEQLNRETRNLTYDKEKTQDINNFTFDVDDIYNFYMYEKEVSKLNASTDKILPAVKIAVEWWANRISITEKKEDIFDLEYRNKGPIPPITPEQLANFKRILSEKIMDKILNNNRDLVKVGTYDYPVVILCEAIKEAGIDLRRIPDSNITMYIRAYWVDVEEYSEEIELYNSATKEDIEEIKNIYFEEKIRMIANEIYEKVVAFVNENKEDDDIFYEYAFIKLNNGQEIRYSFDEDTIELTLDKECNYLPLMPTKIEITGENTRLELEKENISYDTSLKEKIARCKREKIKLGYEKELLKQKTLSREIKDNIRQQYTSFKNALSNMTYDKEKTRTYRNFTSSIDEVYDSHMSEKEMAKLAKSTDKVLPVVKVAVEWWANRISNIEENDDRLWVGFRKVALPPITEEQISNFKQILTRRIMAEMSEIHHYDIPLKIGGMDYPMIILSDALEEAGISKRRMPGRSLHMYILAYRICVDLPEERGKEIYNSTTKEDIEEIKKKYLKKINYSSAYTLHIQ